MRKVSWLSEVVKLESRQNFAERTKAAMRFAGLLFLVSCGLAWFELGVTADSSAEVESLVSHIYILWAASIFFVIGSRWCDTAILMDELDKRYELRDQDAGEICNEGKSS